MDNFKTYLEQEAIISQSVLAEFLETWFKRWQGLEPTFQTMIDNLKPYLLTGGKWGRPLLARLAYELGGSKPDKSIYLASVSTEVFHRFLLCHDDIIDRDMKRHGLDTLEKIYSQEQKKLQPKRPMKTYALAMAMESGDLIHTLTYQIILASGLKPVIANQLIQGFVACAHETVAGWRLESIIKQQLLAKVKLEQVERAMKLVSAQYSVVWPLRFGQILAGKPLGQWDKALEAYGLNVGMAFQIQDDLLGIFGQTKDTGKPVGNDFREGKKSLVLIKVIKEHPNHNKPYLSKPMGAG